MESNKVWIQSDLLSAFWHKFQNRVVKYLFYFPRRTIWRKKTKKTKINYKIR